MEHAWYRLSSDDVLQRLKSSRHGLANEEALQRLQKYGPNRLPAQQPTRWFLLVLRQCKSALVYILFAASAVSIALGDFVDAYVILAAVVINVIVGFIQEHRAERALIKLQEIVAHQTLVLRDDQETLIPSDDVVRGDVVVLKTGSRIPADGRLIKSVQLSVNESSLTGESFSVPKLTRSLEGKLQTSEQGNMVFLGTTVVQGEGVFVVTATGVDTEIGLIAAMMQQTPESSTPLQRRLQQFSAFLGAFVLLLALIVFLLGLAVGKPLTEIFALSVAVSVAAIPEGLLVGVTAILAVGVKRILQHKALTRSLVAAETLGSTTVICVDKTGTLTEGLMSVVRLVTEEHDLGLAPGKIFALDGVAEESSALLALRIGMLCNDAHIEHEDQPLRHRLVAGTPTECALVYAAHAMGLERRVLEKMLPRLASIPFDSEKKYMVTLHARDGSEHYVFAKGAPEHILALCSSFDHEGKPKPLTDEKRRHLLATNDRFSSQGLRVIALAYRRVSKDVRDLTNPATYSDLTFVGFMGMKDPLRAEAAETIRLCRNAGIRIVMITGDHPLTAKAIAEELGLPSKHENIMTGKMLAETLDHTLAEHIEKISVFARVSPQDKHRIVDAWQAKGEVVAMTGDGVNDAPALKSADIGIALGSGTEVAKEAADIVLLDNNFSTIVAAVEQGRVLYENTKKVILYLLADSYTAVLIVLCSLLASIFFRDFPIPLLAAQIIWINFIADTLPSLALTVEPEETEVMRQPPRNPKEPVMTYDIKVMTAVISIITGLATFAVFFLLLRQTGSVTIARSVAFTSLGVNSLLYVLSVRTMRHHISFRQLFSNPSLLLMIGLGLILQIAAVTVPILQGVLHTVSFGHESWLIIITVAVAVLLIIEAAKHFIMKRMRQA